MWRLIQKMKWIREPCFFNAFLNNSVTKAHKRGQVRFVSQGESLNNYARDLYALSDDVPIECIPNPVPFETDFDVNSCHKDNLIIFIGRLESQKRAWLFCEVARRMPELQFVVIGKVYRRSEENRSVLDPYIDGKVPNLSFAGHLDGQAKHDYLKRAKILLNTSIWEGIPVSFLEALAVGTLIVSNVNPDNLVERFGVYVGEVGGDGFDGVDLFVSAIQGLMQNEERRRGLARSSVAYIRRRHSIETFRKCMHEVLTEEAAEGLRRRKSIFLRGTRNRSTSLKQVLQRSVFGSK